MAQLIKTTGVFQTITPQKGKMLSLKELQNLVGGYIEGMPISNGRFVYWDEEGQLKRLPPNPAAKAALGLPFMVVGNVVVCEKGEWN